MFRILGWHTRKYSYMLNWRLSIDSIILKQNYIDFFPDVSSFCDKCQTDVATPLHSYILCSQLISFCTEVFKTLSDIYSVLEPDPLLVMFGISDKIMSLKKSQQQLLSYELIVAKKLILRFWKTTENPSAKLWLEEMIKVLHLGNKLDSCW